MTAAPAAPAPVAAGPSPSRHTLRRALLILGLTLVAYLPALRGGFIWDDDDYVTENATLRSADGLADIWLAPRASPQYYPMVFTTFWLEYQLWGDRPLGYHLDNILLHALAALLLWRVLAQLHVPGAYLAALLFALHPVHVESVAWVSERKNVLSAVFYFAAALAYLKRSSKGSGFRIQGSGEGSREGSGFRVQGSVKGSFRNPEPRPLNPLLNPEPRTLTPLYVAALVLFVLALLSKTVTCSLPAALLLVGWWKTGRITRRDLLALLPFFVIALPLALNTARLEVSHVQATGSEWDLSLIDRTLIAGWAVWFYAGKLLLPVGLSFIYPKWTIDPALVWQWALPAGVVVALAVLYAMRRRWGRGPLVAALIFAGTLFPALGFFNIWPMRYTYVADHYPYHASAALIALIAAGASRLGRPAYILIVPLLLLTILRAGVFRDAQVLWRDTLAKNPDSWMVHLNLARTLLRGGSPAAREEAWSHFEQQVQLAPHLPETHWNYGSSLLLQGRHDAALAAYDEAIRLGGDNPLPQAYFGRGMVFMDQGRFAEAAVEFQRAIQLKPDYTAARQQYEQALSRLQHGGGGQGNRM